MERIEKLKSYIAKDPADLFSRHALAMELVKLGDFSLAIQEMEDALRMDENHIGTYYHLGKTYEKINEFDKALQTYHKGIQLAQAHNKQHELRELKGALNLLNDELL